MNPKPSHLQLLEVGEPYLVEHLAFWQHCAASELRFQRCADCLTWRHPPGPACPQCHSLRSRWDLAPAGPTLFSYTVVHHPAAPVLKEAVPYNVAIVAYPTPVPLRLISSVIDAEPEELRIGMALSLAWVRSADGWPLPVFRKGPIP
jgi:uncharacterized OB-fold protein